MIVTKGIHHFEQDERATYDDVGPPRFYPGNRASACKWRGGELGEELGHVLPLEALVVEGVAVMRGHASAESDERGDGACHPDFGCVSAGASVIAASIAPRT
jgi:hypothetical protein